MCRNYCSNKLRTRTYAVAGWDVRRFSSLFYLDFSITPCLGLKKKVVSIFAFFVRPRAALPAPQHALDHTDVYDIRITGLIVRGGPLYVFVLRMSARGRRGGEPSTRYSKYHSLCPLYPEQ